MNITVTFKNFEPSEHLRQYAKRRFEKLELNRVESSHYAGNESSGRVMEKCGMTREGTGEQERKVKGVFRTVIRYGITKEQWNNRRAFKP